MGRTAPLGRLSPAAGGFLEIACIQPFQVFAPAAGAFELTFFSGTTRNRGHEVGFAMQALKLPGDHLNP